MQEKKAQKRIESNREVGRSYNFRLGVRRGREEITFVDGGRRRFLSRENSKQECPAPEHA